MNALGALRSSSPLELYPKDIAACYSPTRPISEFNAAAAAVAAFAAE